MPGEEFHKNRLSAGDFAPAESPLDVVAAPAVPDVPLTWDHTALLVGTGERFLELRATLFEEAERLFVIDPDDWTELMKSSAHRDMMESLRGDLVALRLESSMLGDRIASTFDGAGALSVADLVVNELHPLLYKFTCWADEARTFSLQINKSHVRHCARRDAREYGERGDAGVAAFELDPDEIGDCTAEIDAFYGRLTAIIRTLHYRPHAPAGDSIDLNELCSEVALTDRPRVRLDSSAPVADRVPAPLLRTAVDRIGRQLTRLEWQIDEHSLRITMAGPMYYSQFVREGFFDTRVGGLTSAHVLEGWHSTTQVLERGGIRMEQEIHPLQFQQWSQALPQIEQECVALTSLLQSFGGQIVLEPLRPGDLTLRLLISFPTVDGEFGIFDEEPRISFGSALRDPEDDLKLFRRAKDSGLYRINFSQAGLLTDKARSRFVRRLEACDEVIAAFPLFSEVRFIIGPGEDFTEAYEGGRFEALNFWSGNVKEIKQPPFELVAWSSEIMQSADDGEVEAESPEPESQLVVDPELIWNGEVRAEVCELGKLVDLRLLELTNHLRGVVEVGDEHILDWGPELLDKIKSTVREHDLVGQTLEVSVRDYQDENSDLLSGSVYEIRAYNSEDVVVAQGLYLPNQERFEVVRRDLDMIDRIVDSFVDAEREIEGDANPSTLTRYLDAVGQGIEVQHLEFLRVMAYLMNGWVLPGRYERYSELSVEEAARRFLTEEVDVVATASGHSKEVGGDYHASIRYSTWDTLNQRHDETAGLDPGSS